MRCEWLHSAHRYFIGKAHLKVVENIIQIYSVITCGRVFKGELYT